MLNRQPSIVPFLCSLVSLSVSGCGLDGLGGVLGGQDDEKIEQDSFENANAGEEGDSGTADEGPGDSPLNFDFDCVQIDRVEAPKIVPPAGIQMNFRVLDCNGDPLPPLQAENFAVINDEKGLAFGTGLEGGSISGLGMPSNYGLYSVIALDMSDSIFNSGAVDDVIDGARTYLDQLESAPAPNHGHKVALVAFGRPEAYELVADFSSDFEALRGSLEQLRQGESRGSTDLYGAYIQALELVGKQGSDLDLVERFVVVLTDGTHEAGAEEAMQAEALAARDSSAANIYSIGIDGNYDATKLAELASTEENFLHVDYSEQLGSAFLNVAYRVDAMAHSNYSMGICTPISLGDPSLTVKVQLANDSGLLEDAKTVSYSVEHLDGNVGACDAESLMGVPLKCGEDGVCAPACVEMSCGCDGGVVCGQCGAGESCSADQFCEPGEGPGPGVDTCDGEELPSPSNGTWAQGVELTALQGVQGSSVRLAHGGAMVTAEQRSAPLVEDRAMLVRGTWQFASSGFEAREIKGRLTLIQGDTIERFEDVKMLDGTTPGSFSTAEGAFEWSIPAAMVRPGAEYRVELLEMDEHPGNDEAGVARYPREGGSADLGVPAGDMKIKIVLVPITHELNGCSKTADLATMQGSYEDLLYATYPVNSVEFQSHAPYTFTQALTSSGWIALLSEISQLRSSEQADAELYYHGVIAPCGETSGIAGIGYVPNSPEKSWASPYRTSLGVISSPWTFAHELGHNHGRQHVHCSGVESNPDPDYPHEGGSIGAMGYDLRSGDYLNTNHRDFMTYCGDEWVSDYGWNRLGAVVREVTTWAAAGADALPAQDALLMGNIAADGSEHWWVERGSVPELERDATRHAPLRFFDGEQLVDEIPAEYTRLSDDQGVAIRVPLPANFSRVSHFEHPIPAILSEERRDWSTAPRVMTSRERIRDLR